MIADDIRSCTDCGSFVCDGGCTLIQTTIDFSCIFCGAPCDLAPADGSGAICPAHCEDHDFQYDPMVGCRHCIHCGMPLPHDW